MANIDEFGTAGGDGVGAVAPPPSIGLQGAALTAVVTASSLPAEIERLQGKGKPSDASILQVVFDPEVAPKGKTTRGIWDRMLRLVEDSKLDLAEADRIEEAKAKEMNRDFPCKSNYKTDEDENAYIGKVRVIFLKHRYCVTESDFYIVLIGPRDIEPDQLLTLRAIAHVEADRTLWEIEKRKILQTIRG